MKILFTSYRTYDGVEYRFSYNSKKILSCEKVVKSVGERFTGEHLGYSFYGPCMKVSYVAVGSIHCSSIDEAKELVNSSSVLEHLAK